MFVGNSTIFRNFATYEKNYHIMKKILLMLVMVVAAFGIASAEGKSEITFDHTSHDFGTIKAKDGPVTAVFDFTNTGDTPLVIVSVTNGGCGCTKPSFPAEPIAPGKKGEVKITFDPKGRSGEFDRSVRVKTADRTKRVRLTFSGVIVP